MPGWEASFGLQRCKRRSFDFTDNFEEKIVPRDNFQSTSDNLLHSVLISEKSKNAPIDKKQTMKTT